MIQIEQLTFRYTGSLRPVFTGLDLLIPSGSRLVVAGPSGSGKSTLLRCLNGLVPHFSGGELSGTLRVNGLEPAHLGPEVMSRHVGFVFQDPEAQFVLDRVEDEVAFALENAGVPSQEMRIRVEELLELLQLTDLRQRRLDSLSGGEKQRVAIASALVLRPAILALDEPSSQLDPQAAEGLMLALQELNHKLGTTIVIAEHRLERILPYADLLVYLDGDGEHFLCGSPRQVLRQIELVPPVTALGKKLGWDPLPLTPQEASKFVEKNSSIHCEMRVPSPGNPPALIQVVNLEVELGGKRVLDQISLEIKPEEILCLMGANGAGKTTLLRCLVGLVQRQAGRITLAGVDTSGMATDVICRRVGYLPQDPNALLFADTVLDELKITLHNHRMDEQAAQPALLLTRLGLEQHAADYSRDLSVGERQRVALAAIMVTHPGVLLLDEPTRGLDYVAKLNLSEILHRFRQEGMAVLVVTHDVELAANLADRVIILDAGRIVAEGDPRQVLASGSAFAPQIAQLFPGMGWLTVDQVLNGLVDQAGTAF